MAKSKVDKWLTDEGLTLIKCWSREGLSLEQIAKDKMHIAKSTLMDYKAKYADISAAIEDGREKADLMVKNAVFQSAIGYWTTTEKVTEERTDPESGATYIASVKTKEAYIAPSINAQRLWLHNRCGWDSEKVIQEKEDPGIVILPARDSDE